MKTDPRVQAYIESRPDFARPILDRIRQWVNEFCPEGEESLKWGMPYILYKGEMLVGMAAFSGHVAINFWRGEQVLDDPDSSAMGQFGRIASLEDLPDRAHFQALMLKAMALTDAGAKPTRTPTRAEAPVPDDLQGALETSPAAASNFATFPPGAKRDYVDWVNSAKRPETRKRRIDQAVEWISEGKRRNWKYEKG